MEVNKVFERNLGEKYDFPPTRPDEGILLTIEGDILEGGTVKNVQYVNGDKTVDLDGDVQPTIPTVNLKDLTYAEPFEIKPEGTYTSMKQVNVTAKLKDMGTVSITDKEGKTIELAATDTEYGIKIVKAVPALTAAQNIVSAINDYEINPAENDCGLEKITILYGKCTMDPSTSAPTSFSGDNNLNSITGNGHYPVVITPRSESVYIYGNLDVTANENTITQVIIYGTDAKHITLTRESTDGGSTWTNQIPVVKNLTD